VGIISYYNKREPSFGVCPLYPHENQNVSISGKYEVALRNFQVNCVELARNALEMLYNKKEIDKYF
jgi:hypothetical protein